MKLLSIVAAGLFMALGCKAVTKSGDCCSSDACEPAAMKQSVADAPTASPATLYTCTMHPEVISKEPGDCPKCGMKLVEKK